MSYAIEGLSKDIDTQAASNPLWVMRTWPDTAWCQQWLTAASQVILSELALLEVWYHPERIDELPARPLALHTEIQLLRQQQPELAELELPITVIQIGDQRWVELTLECQPVILWEQPCSN